MKKLLLITTGGTIAQTRTNGMLDVDAGKSGDTLLSNILQKSEALNVENIDIKDLFCIDSSNMTPSHWVKLIRALEDNYDEYDAFVITHGTDTLSYTCAALSYALGNAAKPIVLTGSQVPYGAVGSDAERNLENAIRVAAQDEIELKGVVGVFGSRIITGTRVKKLSEFDYEAFDSFNKECLGNIGTKLRFNTHWVKEHNERYGNAKCKEELKSQADFAMESILVLNEFPGVSAGFVETAGAKAVILRAYACGNSNVDENGGGITGLYKYLRERKIPIVVTSQRAKGKATMSDYKPGILAKQLGGVPAYDMSIEALTVKMGWLIGQGLGYDEVKRALLMNVRGEIEVGEMA